jgi:CheY-like chemotaxis protein
VSARLLVVEPDGPGRTIMERALVSAGYAVVAVGSAREAVAPLRACALDLAIVDERAGEALLDDVRWLHAEHPTLPVVVTGALLSQRVLLDLLRLGAIDALAKPFTPVELREAVSRALLRRDHRHLESLELAASIGAGRRALGKGNLPEAKAALGRARACSPLDAEPVGLAALVAELEGRDADADRGYRAALALRQDEASPAPDPYEGLARLAAYGDARPAVALAPRRAGQPLWLVTDPAQELKGVAPSGPGPHVAVMALGIAAEGSGVFLRDGEGPRAFALLAGPARPDAVAAALARLGGGPLVASEATRAAVDLGRIEELRGSGAATTAAKG